MAVCKVSKPMPPVKQVAKRGSIVNFPHIPEIKDRLASKVLMSPDKAVIEVSKQDLFHLMMYLTLREQHYGFDHNDPNSHLSLGVDLAKGKDKHSETLVRKC